MVLGNGYSAALPITVCINLVGHLNRVIHAYMGIDHIAQYGWPEGNAPGDAKSTIAFMQGVSAYPRFKAQGITCRDIIFIADTGREIPNEVAVCIKYHGLIEGNPPINFIPKFLCHIRCELDQLCYNQWVPGCVGPTGQQWLVGIGNIGGRVMYPDRQCEMLQGNNGLDALGQHIINHTVVMIDNGPVIVILFRFNFAPFKAKPVSVTAQHLGKVKIGAVIIPVIGAIQV